MIEKFLQIHDPASFEVIVREISAKDRILVLLQVRIPVPLPPRLCVCSRCVLVVRLQDNFANYVIQKALAVEHPIVHVMVENIRPHLPAIKGTPYGKKLTSKIQKKFPLQSDSSPDNTPPKAQ